MSGSSAKKTSNNWGSGISMISTLLTVILYIEFFTVSTLVFKIADNIKSELKKKSLLICGIVFMATFACIRDISVGTDTADTISMYFVDQYTNNIDFANALDFLHGDILYFAISNIIHFFHLGPRTFLFVLEICILAPVTISAYIKRDSIPIHVTMLIFSILYYQLGFNWIRQSAASAFILLTVVYVQKKSFKGAIISFALAVLFHSSATIGLALLFLTYIFVWIKNRIKGKHLRLAYEFCFIGLFILLLLQWERILSFGISYGIFPERYSGYLRVFSGQTTVESWFLVGKKTYIEYFLRIVLIVFPFIISKKYPILNERGNMNYYKMLGVISLVIYSYILFSMHSAYGNRITYSVEYIQILNLGMCYSKPSGRKGTVPLRNVFVIGIVVLYNIWIYYVLGWHDTVPFVFGL